MGLPVYLDTLGTVLASALAGPLAGILTGVLSQAVRSLYESFIWLPFALVQVVIALLTALAARHAGFRSVGFAIGWGALAGLVGGAASAVISYVVFQGVTATGVTAVTTLLAGAGLSRAQAVTVASVGTDLVDKVLTFVLVGATLRSLPLRIAGRFEWAPRAVGR